MAATTTLKVKLVNLDARVPTQGTKFSAGYDLYAPNYFIIKPKSSLLVDIGLQLEIPEGYYGRIADRSSIASKYDVHVHAGVIDSDYRGNIKILLFNHSKESFSAQKDERIAQLILEKIAENVNVVVESVLSSTDRGEGGFGSTNNH